MSGLAAVATVTLLGMLVIALHNGFAFPRLSVQPTGEQRTASPGVSILIPARDEAEQIAATVTALLQQCYPNFEVLLLDDQSTDGTATVATAAAADDRRFRALAGQPLPRGWTGKNWACHQLAAAAQHELLLFTDADVQWQPGALAAVVAMQEQQRADLLTVWPTQVTVSWAERLVVPLMGFAVWAYLPIALVHRTPHPVAAAANGQCMLFRRSAYMASGGHAAIRAQVLDDMRLAQRIKAEGNQLRMADAAGLIRCRMYRDWPETTLGYAKNILAGHGNSVRLLLLSTLLHLLIFVGPWLWLGTELLWPGGTGAVWPLWPLLLIGLGWLVRALTAHATGQRVQDALLMPLSVLLMSHIALQAIRWHYQGGPRWKGRQLPNG